MSKVVKALSAEEIARVEARQAEHQAELEKVPPVFVGPNADKRKMTVTLEFPVSYDGIEINDVTIRRPQMNEWRRYLRDCQDAVNEKGEGADDFVDQPWLSIPAVVLESLDFVDASKVEAAQEGFFAKSSLPQGQDKDQT